MSQENQAAEQQQEQPQELTQEEIVAQIDGFRNGIYQSAVDNKLSFDVVFNALSQAAASFVYDYLLVTEGKLTDENVANAVGKFASQTEAVSKYGLETMRETARRQAAEQQASEVTDVEAKPAATEV